MSRIGDFQVATYRPGDIVKVEFKDEAKGLSEWVWVQVDSCDEERRVIYGRLDNEPIAVLNDRLHLGKQLAVSYDLVRDVWKDPAGPVQ